MKIQVTQDDIKKGHPASACSCPIALAINRVLPSHTWWCTVTPNTIKIFNYEKDYIDYYSAPEIATDFINKFDNGETVEPFEFEI